VLRWIPQLVAVDLIASKNPIGADARGRVGPRAGWAMPLEGNALDES